MQYCGLDGHGSGDAMLEEEHDLFSMTGGLADGSGYFRWGKGGPGLQLNGQGSSTGRCAAHGSAKDREGVTMQGAWKRGSRATP